MPEPQIDVQSKEIQRFKPAKTEISLIEQYREMMGSLIDLSDDQIARLKRALKTEIEQFKQNSGNRMQMIQDARDMMDGVIEDPDLPFEGAVSMHIPIVLIFGKVFHSIERRSILGTDSIWYAESDIEQLEDKLPDIEDYFNLKARTDWNIKEFLSDAFWIAGRDGACVGHVDYVFDSEKTDDVVLVVGAEDYLQEFPTPQESGMNQKEWEKNLHLSQSASEENPLEIPIEYEKVTYRGPKGYAVDMDDFVILPAWANSFDRSICRGWGKRFSLRRAEVIRKKKEGEFYEDAVDRVVSKKKSAAPRASDTASGVVRSGDSDYEFYEFVYRFRLDRGGEERKLVVTYSFDDDEIMKCKFFSYRVDNWVIFHIDKRTGELVGNSIGRLLMDLSDEISSQHSQRINSRKISEVPSFKGQLDAKGKDFDPDKYENRWRPGVIFWLKNPDAFEQFIVQPVNLESSLNEEALDLRYATLLLGVDPALFSGAAPSQDPSAPGNKTFALISQSNLRMDDPLSELRSAVEEVGNICVALEYQFGPPILEFKSSEKGQFIKKKISKRFLRTGIKMNMQGVTVALNPEAEFAKWMNYYAFLTKEPSIAKSAVKRVEILRQGARRGRIPGRDKFIPSLQELEQEDAQATALAQQQQLQLQQQQQQLMLKKLSPGNPEFDKAVEIRARQIAQSQNAGEKGIVDSISRRAKVIKSVHDLTKAITQGGSNGNS